MKKTCLVLSLLVMLMAAGCGTGPAKTTVHSFQSTPITSTATSSPPTISAVVTKNIPSLTLEKYDGGFFTFNNPTGWEVVTAGGCSTFAFYTRDKDNPANQVFYFGEIGPVYLAQEQKEVDQNYVDMGGSLPS
jgi:hypothetical protein